jgi:phage/plasmid-like protein (TIGR03299 family)
MNTNTNFSADSLLNSAFEGIQVNNLVNSDAVATLLDKFGLRWSVSKQPLLLPSGDETGFFGIVREDIQKTFATCKDGYVPYQNSELAELLHRISEKTGYEIHSGGMFNDGGKVYLQLSTGNEINGIGKNRTKVKGYVTGINGHDGTTSLKWGEVNFTICCKNTFASASGSLQQSARHTASIHDKVEQSIREITGIATAEKSIFDTFIKLSEIPVTKDNIAKIVREVTKVDISLPSYHAQKDVSQYAMNRSEELLTSISNEMNSKGESLWGLFSGVTHYTSHKLSVPKRENARLESKYVGSGASIDNNAFNTILNFASIN